MMHLFEGPGRRLRGPLARLRTALALFVAVVALTTPGLLAAQTTPLAANPQMRHFWHVFVAYAIAWVLIFGWLVSILRRLRRVEERLER